MTRRTVLLASIALFSTVTGQAQPPTELPRSPDGHQWKQPVDAGKKFNPDAYPGTNPAEAQAEKIQTGWNLGVTIARPLVICAIAALILSGGAWIYIKLSATTDPLKLAASDPWIRERLAEGRSQPRSGRAETVATNEERPE